ncbi:MAG TPA: hypothetical protein VNB49_17580 [Candidatus Dormibacteraeota bacterium]|nr:hypothetical protein [Candidatus Dormibacteraeota bacterium]
MKQMLAKRDLNPVPVEGGFCFSGIAGSWECEHLFDGFARNDRCGLKEIFEIHPGQMGKLREVAFQKVLVETKRSKLARVFALPG